MNIHAFTKEKRLVYGKIGAAEENASAALFFCVKGCFFLSLISVSNLSFSYEGSVGPVFENVSFQMDTNWRLGFIGRNGRGKTTFLRLLMGEFAYEGSIHASVEFEYFPYPVEDPEDLTVNVLEGMDPMLESWRLLRELSLLQLSEDVLYRPFSTLSYG